MRVPRVCSEAILFLTSGYLVCYKHVKAVHGPACDVSQPLCLTLAMHNLQAAITGSAQHNVSQLTME